MPRIASAFRYIFAVHVGDRAELQGGSKQVLESDQAVSRKSRVSCLSACVFVQRVVNVSLGWSAIVSISFHFISFGSEGTILGGCTALWTSWERAVAAPCRLLGQRRVLLVALQKNVVNAARHYLQSSNCII